MNVGWIAAIAVLAPGTALAGAYEDGLAAAAHGDSRQALQAFRAAATAGDARAQFNLGRIYLNGLGTPVDQVQALVWTRKAADQGLPGAQFDLATMYERGLGVRRDGARAAAWYRKAAGRGFTSAELKLGDLALRDRDLAQAEAWYRRAAEQGDAEAQYRLGMLDIRIGRIRAGASPATQFAAIMDTVFGRRKWRQTGGYRTAAQENLLRARGALTVAVGTISRHSIGRPGAPGAYDAVVDGMTLEQAAARLRRARAPFRAIFAEAAHGDQGPHLHLEPYSPDFAAPRGLHLAAFGPGKEVAAQNDDALTWLRRAADQGHPGAQLGLGQLYAQGDRKLVDLPGAYSWIAVATDNPGATPSIRREADQALSRLRARMKAEDVARSQLAARRFSGSVAAAASDAASNAAGP